MRKKFVAAVLGAGVLMTGLGAVSVSAAPSATAYNGNCTYDRWGSSEWRGERKYRCDDGDYTLKKDSWRDWDDPYSRYDFERNDGKYKGDCRYSSYGGYNCDVERQDRYGYGYDSYGGGYNDPYGYDSYGGGYDDPYGW